MTMINGLADLAEAIRAVEAQLTGERLAAALTPGAEIIRQHAVALAPQRTGALRHAIELDTQTGAHSATVTVQVADSAPGGAQHDAIFVEYGTSRMPAEPFMRPAFDVGAPAAAAAITQTLQDSLT